MSDRRIELTLQPVAHASRLLVFPDGVTRHITLTDWEWQVFDRVPHRDLLPDGAYRHALTFWVLDGFNAASAGHPQKTSDGDDSAAGGFEGRLRRSLVRMIHANMRSMCGQPRATNDEFS